MDKNTAGTLVRVYAVIIWLFALALITGGVAILVMGPQWMVQYSGVNQQLTPIPAVVFTVIAVVLLVLALFDIIVGIGAWKLSSWARIPAIVASVIHLFSFPFGTAFGIFGIWLFGFDDGVKECLGKSPVQKPAAQKTSAPKAPAKKARKRK